MDELIEVRFFFKIKIFPHPISGHSNTFCFNIEKRCNFMISKIHFY